MEIRELNPADYNDKLGMTNAEAAANEPNILDQLLTAANYRADESQLRAVDVKRDGKVLFTITIQPLSEEEIQQCRKDATKYYPNPQSARLPKIEGDTDLGRLRSFKVLRATVPADRERIWGNREAMSKLGALEPVDMVDILLKSGEKNALLELIDEISGFGESYVEFAKN